MHLTPDQNRLVEILFDRVCDLAMPEALALLESDCDDPAVRDAVRRLLEAEHATQRDPGGQLRRDLAGALDQGIPDKAPPDQIGPYRIIETLGEGGMGVVYLADQEKPVKRRVALKIIKLGMDSEAVVTRFEAERQALAMMDHPNVASVFGGGKTEQGRPYFVMEYVDGVSITRYCDEHQLTIKERLDLFMKVCDAVQHAHQKGIIHRDIKPANVMVSEHEGKAVPRVIDFGVAKALHEKLTEKTLMSRQGQLIGTLEYMSPEQAEMTRDDIDTRSDIYSLGVLLYELLTGVLPFDSRSLREASLLETRRIICEEEPPKPSLRLNGAGDATTAIAERRSTPSRALGRDLRGDLDWIVMKCLEKSRARRYDTARGLAEDIKRHLSYEPVLAGPPSAAYRISRFVQRNRGGVIAAGLVTSILILGMAGTGWGYFEAKNQARRAELNATETVQVAAFQAERLGDIDPEMMGIRIRRALIEASESNRKQDVERALAGINLTDIALVTLKSNIFDQTLVAIDERFIDQPRVQAQLLQSLANTTVRLGMVELAEEPQQRALAIRRDLFGDQHSETLESINGLGRLYEAQGDLQLAEAEFAKSLTGRRAEFGNRSRETIESLNNMGNILVRQNRLSDAKPLLQESLNLSREFLGDDHPDTFGAMNSMATLLEAEGDLKAAEQYFRLALEGRQRVLGIDHRETLTSMNNLANVLEALRENVSEAEALYLEAIEGSQRVLGEEHIETLASINNYGLLLMNRGNLSDAEPLIRRAVDGFYSSFGYDHPDTLAVLNNLGTLLERQSKWEDAGSIRVLAVDVIRQSALQDEQGLGSALLRLGKNQMMQSNFADAERTLAECLDIRRRVLAEGHWYIWNTQSHLGEAIALQSRFDEAEKLLVEAAEEIAPPESWSAEKRNYRIAAAINRVIDLYVAWDLAESESGYAVKATEWQARLDALEAVND